QATVKAGVASLTAPAALAGMVSSSILSLTTGVIKTMYIHKLKQLTAVMIALVAALGVGWASFAVSATNEPEAPRADGTPAKEQKAEAGKQEGTGQFADTISTLLRHRKVLRELKCTVEQWDTLEDILEAADKRIQKAAQAMQNVPPPVNAATGE